jgi:hypothetical protein
MKMQKMRGDNSVKEASASSTLRRRTHIYNVSPAAARSHRQDEFTKTLTKHMRKRIISPAPLKQINTKRGILT